METQPNPISAFFPTPAQAEYIIHSITSRDTTLAHIGAHCGVTVETLTCWLASPAIRARLEAADTTTCHHIRVRANILTPLVLAAAAKLLEDFIQPPTPTRHSIDPALLALRRAETARKAAALVFRLTNHQPSHTRRAAAAASRAPISATSGNIPPAPPNDQTVDNNPAPAPRHDPKPTLNSEEPDLIFAPAAPVDTCDNAESFNTSAHTDQVDLSAPDSSKRAPAPAAAEPPDPAAPATIEHVLDLIATLTPNQIAELSALTTPLDSNAHLALTAEDSS